MDHHCTLATKRKLSARFRPHRILRIVPVPGQHDLRVRALRRSLIRLRRHRSGPILPEVRVARGRRRVRDALDRHAARAELAVQRVEEGRPRRISNVTGLGRAAGVNDRHVAADAVVDVVTRLRRGAANAAGAAAAGRGRWRRDGDGGRRGRGPGETREAREARELALGDVGLRLGGLDGHREGKASEEGKREDLSGQHGDLIEAVGGPEWLNE